MNYEKIVLSVLGPRKTREADHLIKVQRARGELGRRRKNNGQKHSKKESVEKSVLKRSCSHELTIEELEIKEASTEEKTVSLGMLVKFNKALKDVETLDNLPKVEVVGLKPKKAEPKNLPVLFNATDQKYFRELQALKELIEEIKKDIEEIKKDREEIKKDREELEKDREELDVNDWDEALDELKKLGVNDVVEGEELPNCPEKPEFMGKRCHPPFYEDGFRLRRAQLSTRKASINLELKTFWQKVLSFFTDIGFFKAFSMNTLLTVLILVIIVL